MTQVHFIFDCDGVLVDSEPLSMKIDVEILAENGVVMSEAEAHQRFVGKTFAAMLDEIRRDFGVSFPADASEQKDLRLLQLYARELKVVEGVLPALEALMPQRHVPGNLGARLVAGHLAHVGVARYAHEERQRPTADESDDSHFDGPTR